MKLVQYHRGGAFAESGFQLLIPVAGHYLLVHLRDFPFTMLISIQLPMAFVVCTVKTVRLPSDSNSVKTQ